MYSTYFSFLWKQPQYKYKQYIYTYRLSFNIQHNRFNRITLLLFLVRGKQKKKKKPVTGQHRGVQLKKKKTKQNKTKKLRSWRDRTRSYGSSRFLISRSSSLLYYIILLTAVLVDIQQCCIAST